MTRSKSGWMYIVIMILALVAELFQVFGFVTPAWKVYNYRGIGPTYHFGLWFLVTCVKFKETCDTSTLSGDNGKE